ncbi:MAG: hypothetical protein V3T22_07145, partial [Planctomycetota bacterium]
VAVLQRSESLEDVTGAIPRAQARAHLELGEIDAAFEYLARAEERVGAGSELMQGLRARCEAARASKSDESTPVEASHVFEGDDR